MEQSIGSGLSTADAQAYQRTHGYNEIVEHREPLFEKIVRRSISPISGMLVLASLLSFIGGKAFDGSFILVLLVLNIGITVWQEHKADTAIAKLNENLSSMVKVMRDGAWQTLSARLLVPGDVMELHTGNIVPADAAVVESNTASASEAALTGESLPKDKKAGDPLYSGSFLASGFIRARVTATGNQTSFGKTLAKAGVSHKRSALEKDILRITRFLSIASLAAVMVLTLALLAGDESWLEILRLDLALIIAGIPISLPTVMTLIIALGVLALAKKKVIVRHLSSLEELANTDLLLTDKTGTLTKNHIVISEVVGYGATAQEAHRLAALVAREEPDSILNAALFAGEPLEAVSVLRYIPGDSTRKRSTLIMDESGNATALSLGAPQIIAGLCALSPETAARFEADVERFARRGYRSVALAKAPHEREEGMRLLGLFALSDELRDDAKDVVGFLARNGIEVSMVTGDNRAIAREIAERLGLSGGNIMTHDELAAAGPETLGAAAFRDTKAFAEILPEDKLALVERARTFYTVASNGDGINDLPALRAANVGFAVSNAVDALKGSADIVLLSDGIGVMKDAFIEGRKIFQRLYTYSLYRISESFRLIITIVILGMFVGTYPLSPLQLILLALLNDVPIISLATDRVKIGSRPSKINVGHQFIQSLLYGCVGIVNSMLLYFIATWYLQLPLPVVETLFFLKLTVSGHLLIYVAHTKERWWRYLPSKTVVVATTLTQVLATALALSGLFMPVAISWQLALFIWVWSLVFMQISELIKQRE